MITVAKLVAYITANIDGLRAGTSKANQMLRDVQRNTNLAGKAAETGFGRSWAQASRETMSGLSRVGTGIRNMSKDLQEFGNRTFTIGTQLSAAVSLPLGMLAKMGLEFNDLQKRSHIAFTTILRDSKRATELMTKIRDMAAETPFEYTDLIRYTQRLVAMGMSADKVVPAMRAIGDTVAAIGGGEEQINRVTRAIGQMIAKGRVQGDELLQLNEAGINGLQALADAAGVTTFKMQKLIEKGMIPANQAVDVLLWYMENRAPDAMKKMAGTLMTGLSNLRDYANQALGALFEPLYKDSVSVLQKVQVELKKYRDLFTNMSEETKKRIGMMVLAFASLGPAIVIISGLAKGLSLLMSPLGLVSAAVVAIGYHFATHQEDAKLFKDALLDMYPVAKELALEAFQFLKDVGVDLVGIMKEMLPIAREMISWIRDMLRWFNGLDDGTKKWIYRIGLLVIALQAFKNPINIAIGLVTTFWGAIKAAAIWTGRLAGALLTNLIPALKGLKFPTWLGGGGPGGGMPIPVPGGGQWPGSGTGYGGGGQAPGGAPYGAGGAAAAAPWYKKLWGGIKGPGGKVLGALGPGVGMALTLGQGGKDYGTVRFDVSEERRKEMEQEAFNFLNMQVSSVKDAIKNAKGKTIGEKLEGYVQAIYKGAAFEHPEYASSDALRFAHKGGVNMTDLSKALWEHRLKTSPGKTEAARLKSFQEKYSLIASPFGDFSAQDFLDDYGRKGMYNSMKGVNIAQIAKKLNKAGGFGPLQVGAGNSVNKEGMPKLVPTAPEEDGAALQRQQEMIKDILRDKQKAIDLFGKESHVAKATWDIHNGEYAKWSPKQKERLISLAMEMDALESAKKHTEEFNNVKDDLLKTEMTLAREIGVGVEATETQKLAWDFSHVSLKGYTDAEKIYVQNKHESILAMSKEIEVSKIMNGLLNERRMLMIKDKDKRELVGQVGLGQWMQMSQSERDKALDVFKSNKNTVALEKFADNIAEIGRQMTFLGRETEAAAVEAAGGMDIWNRLTETQRDQITVLTSGNTAWNALNSQFNGLKERAEAAIRPIRTVRQETDDFITKTLANVDTGAWDQIRQVMQLFTGVSIKPMDDIVKAMQSMADTVDRADAKKLTDTLAGTIKQDIDDLRAKIGGIYDPAIVAMRDWEKENKETIERLKSLYGDEFVNETINSMKDLFKQRSDLEKIVAANEQWRDIQADLHKRIAMMSAKDPFKQWLWSMAQLNKETGKLEINMGNFTEGQLRKLFEMAENLQLFEKFATGMGEILSNVLQDFADTGKIMFGNIYSGFRALLVRMAIEYLNSLFIKMLQRTMSGVFDGGQGFGGQAAGGGGFNPFGWLGGLIGNLFGGGGGDEGGVLHWQPGGGPDLHTALGSKYVPAGTTLEVGEYGSEVLTVGGPSSVTPNHKYDQSVGGDQIVVNITQNISTPNADSFRRSQRVVAMEARQAAEDAWRRNR